MILSILVILLALGIGFIHYIQGFFSAMLSAMLVIISVTVALGLQEPVVNLIKPAKMTDSAAGGVMCLLFLATYVILRIIFDKVVPGNVRLNSTVDKVGAGAMGLVAGFFTTGLIAVAMQSMPFDPGSMAARYAQNSETRASGQYQPNQSQVERTLNNQMKSPRFAEKDISTLIVPVDDWVVGLVKKVSEGSLSSTTKFGDVHPDYLQELFGQRAGIQPGSKHVATNYPGGLSQVNVESVYWPTFEPLSQDAELPAVRSSSKEIPTAPGAKEAPVVIVRIKVSPDAGDAGDVLSFSMGSVRMLIHPEGSTAQNLYPIGTMDGAKIWLSRIDDYLFGDKRGGDCTIDLVFDHAEDILDVQVDKNKQQTATIKDGTMLEFKRLGRVDLSNKEVTRALPPPATGAIVIRKPILKPPPKT